ncbi:hypothetical protein CV770_33395 [Bradyrhizobium sp. AC87j1]|uniref:polysaccharide pyruvyl transferase family protein n=1 Tax=Bradyrhizobium sp. AC87j1 TaxID=2055894 RepID=UPI000CECBA66|nr:polysaccharide pyruvyl transferase family protein [Bradyrhizobium sp. AC87j1]PPQ15100.1 hypothetical protein CV770_33395 [Bradyrhizobium sp. AC87j1]
MRVACLANNTGTIPSEFATDARRIMGASGNNLGNLAFWYATCRLFRDEIELVSWGCHTEVVRERVDKFVIPAANFLNPAFDMSELARIIEGLDKECIVFGLGAQSSDESQIPQLKAGTLAFLNAIAARCRTIFVRGDYTADVCAQYGVKNVEIIGCPSIFINPDPMLGTRVEAVVGRPLTRLYAAGATFFPYSGDTSVVERLLFEVVTQRPGSTYLVQDPAPLIQFMADEQAEIDENEPRLIAALDALRGSHDRAWAATGLRRCGRFFLSIDEWLAHAERHDYAVSTRIHGAVLALMAGVPSMVIGHDARVRELAATLKIPCAPPANALPLLADIDQLRWDFRFDGRAFDDNRKTMASRITRYLMAAGFTVSPHLGQMGEVR